MDLLQTCVWMYVLITKRTCGWWQAAEPADSTYSPNLLLKMLFSVLVTRADFKDTALWCLLSDWSPDNEVVFSLTTATGIGDISELPVNRQIFGSINVPRCRVQLFLLLLAAVWSDIDCLAYGEGKSFHCWPREEEILWISIGVETMPLEAWTSTFICQREPWALSPCCPLWGPLASAVSLAPELGRRGGWVKAGWFFQDLSIVSVGRQLPTGCNSEL